MMTHSLARRLVAGTLPLLLVALAPLTGSALENEGQGWFVNTARGPITGKWKLYLEAQPRVGSGGMRQLLVRPAIGYQITEAWSLWQGYAWAPSFDPDRDEQRMFQQSAVETPRGELPVHLTNRTRVEERWIEKADGVSVRLRHMLRATYPLDEAERWSRAAYDELFVTLNEPSGGPRAGFDQNRGFFGVSRKLGGHVTVEAGYLNQFIDSKPDVLRHIGVLALDYAW
jgi:hypothetical protein